MNALLERLHAATDLQQAGRAVCERALALADGGLDQRPLRAMVQLRGPRGYEAFVVVEREPTPEPALPSNTAWSWLVETGAPVNLNVPGKRLVLQDGTRITLQQTRTFGSAVHLSLRGATHVRAWPLRAGGQLSGLLAVELAAPSKVFDADYLPLADHLGLDAVAAVAGPFLACVPPRPSVAVEQAPVVGRVMSERLALMEVFAQLEETVLLRGPVGSGKSRLAEWAHNQSPRASGPFVAAQLQGLPRDLLVGELFGHKGGVFAGAAKDREGLVQAAEGGTLFLDEIDKLPLDAQAVLLELLETRTWRRLGDNQLRQSDVRFVVAANADLESMVREGSFLEDLFSRIDILAVHIPGLDERRDEIEGWATLMLAELGGRLSEGAIAALRAGDYPQNLRQLRAVTVRAFAFSKAAKSPVIEAEHVAAAGRTPQQRRADTGSFDELVSALAEQCVSRGPPPADLGKALLGAVIEEAARHGDLASAFRSVGLGAAVKHRNHRRRYEEFQAELSLLRGWLSQ